MAFPPNGHQCKHGFLGDDMATETTGAVTTATDAAAGLVTEATTTAGHAAEAAGKAGMPQLDFTTFGNIYQPCAALAPGAALTETSIFNYIGLVGMTARATARCDSLAAKGLVTGADTAARADDDRYDTRRVRPTAARWSA